MRVSHQLHPSLSRGGRGRTVQHPRDPPAGAVVVPADVVHGAAVVAAAAAAAAAAVRAAAGAVHVQVAAVGALAAAAAASGAAAAGPTEGKEMCTKGYQLLFYSPKTFAGRYDSALSQKRKSGLQVFAHCPPQKVELSNFPAMFGILSLAHLPFPSAWLTVSLVALFPFMLTVARRPWPPWTESWKRRSMRGAESCTGKKIVVLSEKIVILQ